MINSRVRLSIDTKTEEVHSGWDEPAGKIVAFVGQMLVAKTPGHGYWKRIGGQGYAPLCHSVWEIEPETVRAHPRYPDWFTVYGTLKVRFDKDDAETFRKAQRLPKLLAKAQESDAEPVL